jgi:hypothetical protein
VALLDVYSSSAQPLDTFGRKFRRDLGFEPRIGRRLVNPTQCAAVEFLAELRKSSGRAPRLTVDQTTLSHDETLTGTVEGADNLLLLFVADGGAVTDVSKLMTQALIAHSFRIDMADVAASDGPQLLIAVASAQPLGALQRQPIKAQQFFPQALQAAVINGTSVTATARYFMLSH